MPRSIKSQAGRRPGRWDAQLACQDRPPRLSAQRRTEPWPQLRRPACGGWKGPLGHAVQPRAAPPRAAPDRTAGQPARAAGEGDRQPRRPRRAPVARDARPGRLRRPRPVAHRRHGRRSGRAEGEHLHPDRQRRNRLTAGSAGRHVNSSAACTGLIAGPLRGGWPGRGHRRGASAPPPTRAPLRRPARGPSVRPPQGDQIRASLDVQRHLRPSRPPGHDGRHRQQHRQRQHGRLQVRPGELPGHPLADIPRLHRAERRPRQHQPGPDRAGHDRRRDRRPPHPGQPPVDRQADRHGHPG